MLDHYSFVNEVGRASGGIGLVRLAVLNLLLTVAHFQFYKSDKDAIEHVCELRKKIDVAQPLQFIHPTSNAPRVPTPTVVGARPSAGPGGPR